MSVHKKTRLALAVGLSLAATSTLAAPQQFQTARSFAMSGTGVAIAHPASAASTNPAMMAATHHQWSDDFGLILPSIYVRAADEEETIDQIDDIQDSIDNFNNSTTQAVAIEVAEELLAQLQALHKDTVRINAGVGISIAMPSPTLSVGFFTNANLSATVRANFDEADEALLNQIIIGDVPPVSGNLDDLKSSGNVLAAAVGEVGLAFARSIELSNGDHFQLGISPKYVYLRTLQYADSISSFEDDNFDAKKSQTTKSGFNVDIGAAYAFGESKQWNAGIVAKNLIPMELDSVESTIPIQGEQRVHTLELKPMVTVGIAHQSNHHVVTAEVDLTKQKGFGYADDTQWLALGAEFDAFRYAQLRAGVRQNLASNDDNNGIEEKTQFTAGIGLSPFGARLDIGALFSDADLGASLEFGVAF